MIDADVAIGFERFHQLFGGAAQVLGVLWHWFAGHFDRTAAGQVHLTGIASTTPPNGPNDAWVVR